MKNLKLFTEVTRLDKPTGYMLLFWPCIWGLAISYNFNNGINNFIYFSFLFFLGSVLMRSAGCIVNDIVDKKIDQKVERTRNRPIASEKISITLAIIYVLILCLTALIVLIQFNKLTILLALASMPLAFAYPLMKRFTYWPQLFLGITFNYGLILGWTSIQNDIGIEIIILYIGAIFWTLGYDTIYGYQDIKDDEIIGVKSTSIKFKNNPKKFLSLCFIILSIGILLTGYLMNFKIYYFIFMVFPIFHLFGYQIIKLDTNNPESCLKMFKSNNLFGFILLLNLLIGKAFS